mgnify:CR=1 FL=1
MQHYEDNFAHNSLPISDLQPEYTFVDLQPEGLLKSEDGWIIVNEDEFNLLLLTNNSEQILSEFREKEELNARVRKQEELDYLRQKQQESLEQKTNLQKEFEEFLAWKASQNQ